MKKDLVSIAAVRDTASRDAWRTACDSRQELIIYNWGEYIAEDTISKFEAAYPQYRVIYRTFETNETMYPNLDNTYDVIMPSEYMVCRLINEQRIQPLDWSASQRNTVHGSHVQRSSVLQGSEALR